MLNNSIQRQKITDGFAGQQSCILPEVKRKLSAANALCKNLYITDIGFYPRALQHNRERPKGCAQHVLIYCIEGEGWYKIEKKQFFVKPNQFFILPKGIPHEYGASDKTPWSICWVHFTGEQSDQLAQYIFPRKSAAPQNVSPSPIRQMLFDDILYHLEFMNNTENIIYANYSLHAFLTSFKQVQLKPVDKGNSPIRPVIDLMKKNLDKNLTLEDFAAAANLSVSHLSALFKKATKYSPSNLFTSLKIQKASQLLHESDTKIKEVAYQLGYDDQYHFSRVFKKVMGVSPKEFKSTLK